MKDLLNDLKFIGGMFVFIGLITFLIYVLILNVRNNLSQDIEQIKEEHINTMINRKTITCENKVYKNFSFKNNNTIILLENDTVAYHTLECSKID